MKKMIKIFLCCILIGALVIGFIKLYKWNYYYTRTVPFELAKEIDKFENCYPRNGFDYIENAEVLMIYMIDIYKTIYPPSRQKSGYDSIFVANLAKELDFKKYDYLITYQKQLKELRHSPYLTKTEDDLYFDKKTPLIPTWDSVITDKVYIYRIKKNSKYRAFGP
jgi:hypothetical protein